MLGLFCKHVLEYILFAKRGTKYQLPTYPCSYNRRHEHLQYFTPPPDDWAMLLVSVNRWRISPSVNGENPPANYSRPQIKLNDHPHGAARNNRIAFFKYVPSMVATKVR